MYSWICRLMTLVFMFNVVSPQLVYAQTANRGARPYQQATPYASSTPAYDAPSALRDNLKKIIEEQKKTISLEKVTNTGELSKLYQDRMDELYDLYLDPVTDMASFVALGQVVEEMHQLSNKFIKQEKALTGDTLKTMQEAMSHVGDTGYYDQQQKFPPQKEAAARFLERLQNENMDLDDIIDVLDPLTGNADETLFLSSAYAAAALGQILIFNTQNEDTLAATFATLPQLQQRAMYRLQHLPTTSNSPAILPDLIKLRGEIRSLLYQIHESYELFNRVDFLAFDLVYTSGEYKLDYFEPTKATYQSYVSQQKASAEGGVMTQFLPSYERFAAANRKVAQPGEAAPKGYERKTNTSSYDQAEMRPNDLFGSFLNDFMWELRALAGNENTKPGELNFAGLTAQVDQTVNYVVQIGRPEVTYEIMALLEKANKRLFEETHKWWKNLAEANLDELGKDFDPNDLNSPFNATIESGFATLVQALISYVLSDTALALSKRMLLDFAYNPKGKYSLATKLSAVGAISMLYYRSTHIEDEGPLAKEITFSEQDRDKLVAFLADLSKELSPAQAQSVGIGDLNAGVGLTVALVELTNPANKGKPIRNTVNAIGYKNTLTKPKDDHALTSKQIAALQDQLASYVGGFLPMNLPVAVWDKKTCYYVPADIKVTPNATAVVTELPNNEGKEVRDPRDKCSPKITPKNTAKPLFVKDSKGNIVAIYAKNPRNAYQRQQEAVDVVDTLLKEAALWVVFGEVLGLAFRVGAFAIHGVRVGAITLAGMPRAIRASNAVTKAAQKAARARALQAGEVLTDKQLQAVAKSVKAARKQRFNDKLRQMRQYGTWAKEQAGQFGAEIKTGKLGQVKSAKTAPEGGKKAADVAQKDFKAAQQEERSLAKELEQAKAEELAARENRLKLEKSGKNSKKLEKAKAEEQRAIAKREQLEKELQAANANTRQAQEAFAQARQGGSRTYTISQNQGDFTMLERAVELPYGTDLSNLTGRAKFWREAQRQGISLTQAPLFDWGAVKTSFQAGNLWKDIWKNFTGKSSYKETFFKRGRISRENRLFNMTEHMAQSQRKTERVVQFFDKDGRAISYEEALARQAEGTQTARGVKEAAEMAGKKNYYDILGVERGATEKEIQTAWKRRARELHSDIAGGSDAPMAELNEAYEALGKGKWPNQFKSQGVTDRAAYDRWLGNPKPTADPAEFEIFMSMGKGPKVKIPVSDNPEPLATHISRYAMQNGKAAPIYRTELPGMTLNAFKKNVEFFGFLTIPDFLFVNKGLNKLAQALYEKDYEKEMNKYRTPEEIEEAKQKANEEKEGEELPGPQLNLFGSKLPISFEAPKDAVGTSFVILWPFMMSRGLNSYALIPGYEAYQYYNDYFKPLTDEDRVNIRREMTQLKLDDALGNIRNKNNIEQTIQALDKLSALRESCSDTKEVKETFAELAKGREDLIKIQQIKDPKKRNEMWETWQKQELLTRANNTLVEDTYEQALEEIRTQADTWAQSPDAALFANELGAWVKAIDQAEKKLQSIRQLPTNKKTKALAAYEKQEFEAIAEADINLAIRRERFELQLNFMQWAQSLLGKKQSSELQALAKEIQNEFIRVDQQYDQLAASKQPLQERQDLYKQYRKYTKLVQLKAQYDSVALNNLIDKEIKEKETGLDPLALQQLQHIRQTKDYQTRAAQFLLYQRGESYLVTATPEKRKAKMDKLIGQIKAQRARLDTQDKQTNQLLDEQIDLLVKEAQRGKVTDIVLEQGFSLKASYAALESIFSRNSEKAERLDESWQQKLADVQSVDATFRPLAQTQAAQQALRNQLDQECLYLQPDEVGEYFNDIRLFEAELLAYYYAMADVCRQKGTLKQQQSALRNWYEDTARKQVKIALDPKLSLEEKAAQSKELFEKAMANVQVAADPAANELFEESSSNAYQGAY